jgi:hypothetical protein
MFYSLTLISLVSWVITIFGTSFTYFPADALYYTKSLPPLYWLGVTLAIITALMSILKPVAKGYTRLLPQIILLLYLHSLPIFTYENLPFYDTYQHASGAIEIYHSCSLKVANVYAKEYPSSFILLAQILQLGEGHLSFLMAFLRFYSIAILVLLLILVYATMNLFSPKYSLVACFAFLSVFWVEQPHFSPQAFALILYLIFWFALIKTLVSPERRKSWIMVSLLSLLSINISHPTTPLFLFLSLTSALYVVPILFQALNSKALKFRHSGGMLILLMHVVIWMSWTTFMGHELVLEYGLPMIMQSIKSFGQLQKLSIPTTPETTYFISSTLRQLTVLFTALTGLLILMFLKKREKVGIFLLSGWFIGSFFATPLFLFTETAPILPRVHLFSVFPWSILIALYVDSPHVRRLTKSMLLVSLVIFAMLIPVSKYGAEPFTYLGSSVLSSADFITKNSQTNFLIFMKPAGEEPPFQIYNFYAALHHIELQIYTHKSISNAVRMIKEFRYPIAFTESYKNEFLLRRNLLVIADMEEEISDLFNLIYNSGSARVYG